MSDVLAEQHAVAVCRKAEELLTQLQQSSPPPDATLLRSVDVRSRLFPPTSIMKGTKVQTLGVRAVAGVCMVAWAIIMAMGAIINTHAHR